MEYIYTERFEWLKSPYDKFELELIVPIELQRADIQNIMSNLVNTEAVQRSKSKITIKYDLAAIKQILEEINAGKSWVDLTIPYQKWLEGANV